VFSDPLFDIGANLTSNRFSSDLLDVIQRSLDAGCTKTYQFIGG